MIVYYHNALHFKDFTYYKFLGLSMIHIAIIIILSILSVAGIFYVYLTVSKSISMYKPVRSNSANIIVDKTANNRNYYHDTTSQLAENGNLILVNINDEELKREWEKRSAINFDGLDNKKNFIKYTLYRFMASKGLRKDSVGVTKLSDLEIKHIEDGNTTHMYLQIKCNLN